MEFAKLNWPGFDAAGVVEFVKLNWPGFAAAGVVDPVGADVAVGKRDWPDGWPPPKRPVDAGVFSLFGVPKVAVTGVDVPFPSSFFGPKLKPPPPPAKMPDPCAVVPLALRSPLLGAAEVEPVACPKRPFPPPALPVLAPNSDGAEAPEPELDAVFPNGDGFEPPAAPMPPKGLAVVVAPPPNKPPG